MRRSVFISYKSIEADTAYKVCRKLEENGIGYWMAPESIPAGSDYVEEIPKGIRECRVVLALISKSAQESQWITREITMAVSQNKILIPFMISECEIVAPFDFLFANVQVCPAYLAMEESIAGLIKQIKELVGEDISAEQEFKEAICLIKKERDMRGVSALMRLAERGYLAAQCELAKMFHRGKYIAQDEARATEYYDMAAKRGNAEAQFALAKRCFKGLGIKKDYGQMIVWLEKAAEQNHAEAQFNLGGMYAKGYGVEQDYVQAAAWYESAARLGNPDAQKELGYLYSNGLGVIQNDAKAVEYFKMAAEQGNAEAQYNLGVMYEYARGVRMNLTMALEWYLLAAEKGYAEALYKVGFFYARGMGTGQNFDVAIQYLVKSAQKGNEKARRLLEELV